MLDQLIVGDNIQMGPNAYISWNKVTSKPDVATKSDIPTIPSYITATKITSTTIESPKIIGGSIESNTTINVGTNATIGKYLYMNPIDFGGGIKWNDVAEIYIDPSTKTLVLTGLNNTQIGRYNGNTIIRGNVSFPDSSGLTTTAVFG